MPLIRHVRSVRKIGHSGHKEINMDEDTEILTDAQKQEIADILGLDLDLPE